MQIWSAPGARGDPVCTPGRVIAEDPPAARAGVGITSGRAFVTEGEAAAGPWHAEGAGQIGGSVFLAPGGAGDPLGGVPARLDLPPVPVPVRLAGHRARAGRWRPSPLSARSIGR